MTAHDSRVTVCSWRLATALKGNEPELRAFVSRPAIGHPLADHKAGLEIAAVPAFGRRVWRLAPQAARRIGAGPVTAVLGDPRSISTPFQGIRRKYRHRVTEHPPMDARTPNLCTAASVSLIAHVLHRPASLRAWPRSRPQSRTRTKTVRYQRRHLQGVPYTVMPIRIRRRVWIIIGER